MNYERWRVPPETRLVIETNYGGQQFNVCRDCCATVPTDMLTMHEEWHDKLTEAVDRGSE